MISLHTRIMLQSPHEYVNFCCSDPATAEIYTLSLHDALPISEELEATIPPRLTKDVGSYPVIVVGQGDHASRSAPRSEEHTSELQSRRDLVCRLLLEKKKR